MSKALLFFFDFWSVLDIFNIHHSIIDKNNDKALSKNTVC